MQESGQLHKLKVKWMPAQVHCATTELKSLGIDMLGTVFQFMALAFPVSLLIMGVEFCFRKRHVFFTGDWHQKQQEKKPELMLNGNSNGKVHIGNGK